MFEGRHGRSPIYVPEEYRDELANLLRLIQLESSDLKAKFGYVATTRDFYTSEVKGSIDNLQKYSNRVDEIVAICRAQQEKTTHG
jgi:hypothetical protein